MPRKPAFSASWREGRALSAPRALRVDAARRHRFETEFLDFGAWTHPSARFASDRLTISRYVSRSGRASFRCGRTT
jgi:hypothetical protein